MAVSVSAPPVPAAPIGDVRSETGVLERVLVHRPGRELSRIRPENAESLLFDDVVWPELAAREHAALVEALTGHGVEVLHLSDLLRGALAEMDGRRAAIEAICDGAGRDCARDLREWLSSLDVDSLTSCLIEGATLAESGLPASAATPGPDALGEFAVVPLVNQMFVRDSSAWLGQNLVLGAASNPVRARETRNLGLVYRFHPLFGAGADPPDPIVSSGVEGGDLICLAERAVVIGIGSRTTRIGAERLAAELLQRGYERVIGVRIPDERFSIHLDCLMSFLDHDVVLMDPRLATLPAFEVRPGGTGPATRSAPSLVDAMAEALGIPALRIVEVADEREQWMLAANALAIEPGKVIAFSRNVRTNERIAEAGIELIPVPGEELSRGRGGPRCLTCPLTRGRVGSA